ncbi:hypothetical protein, partial [Pseudoalteromonas piscicida]|uniref:hypothetical protein n=1 Tax=Pseudoalteromonas piscicida TaxID=43662 RepID=UPI001A8D4146
LPRNIAAELSSNATYGRSRFTRRYVHHISQGEPAPTALPRNIAAELSSNATYGRSRFTRRYVHHISQGEPAPTA